jgi:hypothetical protein
MADDSDHTTERSDSIQPLVWSVAAVVLLFIIGSCTALVRKRRRRSQQSQRGQWPHDPVPAMRDRISLDQLPRRTVCLQSPRCGMSLQSGLNELGEAPPPYSARRDIDENHEGPRDPETAVAPSGHPIEPRPAVTMERRVG